MPEEVASCTPKISTPEDNSFHSAPMTVQRCSWAKTDLDIAYHDVEWGAQLISGPWRLPRSFLEDGLEKLDQIQLERLEGALRMPGDRLHQNLRSEERRVGKECRF